MQNHQSAGGLQKFVVTQSTVRNRFSIPARHRSALTIRYQRLEALTHGMLPHRPREIRKPGSLSTSPVNVTTPELPPSTDLRNRVGVNHTDQASSMPLMGSEPKFSGINSIQIRLEQLISQFR